MIKQEDQNLVIINTDDVIKDPDMQIECHVYDLDGNYITSVYDVSKQNYTLDEGILRGELDINPAEREIKHRNSL